jgi:hypothetical protein
MQASTPPDRPRDDAPRLERYHSADDQLIVYNPKSSRTEWISADPRDVVEVECDD